HLPTPPPAVSIPVPNKIPAEPPKVQNVEASLSTTNFTEPVQVESSPALSGPEPIGVVTETVAAVESLSLPVEETVIETRFAESDSEPESVQPEPFWAEEVTTDSVLLDSTPVLVEWEHPEDIPLEVETREVRRTDLGDSGFAPVLTVI